MTMHMGHVALRVTDLDRSVAHAQQVLGLTETRRTATESLLSANDKHHQLQLVAGDRAGFDHVGLEVESEAELEQLRARAEAAGCTLLPAVEEAGLGRAIRFAGPAGIVYEVYTAMARRPLTIDAHLGSGVRKFGHLTFHSAEHAAILGFWLDVLGFRVTDTLDQIAWTRCDADHHGLAVAAWPQGTLLHHHAWEVQDLGALGQYCDDLARGGRTLQWGPVRHGPGFNIATYTADPDGVSVEVYTDLLKVYDEAAYEPIDWSAEPRALNLWGPGPDEAFLQAGVPVLPPEG